MSIFDILYFPRKSSQPGSSLKFIKETIQTSTRVDDYQDNSEQHNFK